MFRRSMAAALVVCSFTWGLPSGSTYAADQPTLELEAKIPLGDVKGRIDHFTADLKRQRLYVAELENNSIGVIDPQLRKFIKRISGFREPQGVAYEETTDTLYVSNAGDGTVLLFGAADLAGVHRMELGDDADNIRVDREGKRVLIGYGSGALAIIDPSTQNKVGDIPLKGHPEAFEIVNGKAFVDVPDAGQIAVADVVSRKQIATWPTREARSNFPRAFDRASNRVLVAFRGPSTFMAFDAQSGTPAAKLAVCGDADDIFVDARRNRVYVSCGEGSIDVLTQRGSEYERIGHIQTSSGARTSFFIPELDRLFVAVRATSREPAAVWVFRPAS
jgi:YVTN family beta-propeller protein